MEAFVIDALKLLQSLQLADSVLPIGAIAHSFGLETLVADGILTIDRLEAFLRDYVVEASVIDVFGCRAAHQLATKQDDRQAAWLELNAQLAALRPARESRAASATLGRRLLQLAVGLHDVDVFVMALNACRRESVEPHISAVFGLVGGELGMDEDVVVLAYLQQSIAALISA